MQEAVGIIVIPVFNNDEFMKKIFLFYLTFVCFILGIVVINFLFVHKAAALYEDCSGKDDNYCKSLDDFNQYCQGNQTYQCDRNSARCNTTDASQPVNKCIYSCGPVSGNPLHCGETPTATPTRAVPTSTPRPGTPTSTPRPNSAGCNSVSASISPNSGNPGTSVTLKLTGDASTYLGDTFGGGLNCSGSWSFDSNNNGSRTCTLGSSSGTWTHTWKHYNGSSWSNTCTTSASYTVGSGAPTVTPLPPTPTPTPTTHTSLYRLSDKPFTKNDTNLAWQTYTGENLDYDFGDVKIGEEKTLYVQYVDDSPAYNVSEVFSTKIKFVGANPKVENVSCSFDPSGNGSQVVLSGVDLGTRGQGSVKFGGKDARIDSWSDEAPKPTPTTIPTVEPSPTGVPTSTPVPTTPAEPTLVPTDTPTPAATVAPTGSVTPTQQALRLNTNTGTQVLGLYSSKSSIVARISEKVPGDQDIPVVLTLDDGRILGGDNSLTCSIGTTTMKIKVKTACRSTGNFTNTNVSVLLSEAAEKAKALVNRPFNIDADGNFPADFNPSLETGKKYKLTIKVPKGISKKIEFTAESGSNILDDLIVPVGDIAPAGNPDGKINALDKSKLSQEWNSITDTSRSGDFNLDNRVNSLDWSCMRNYFNQENQ